MSSTIAYIDKETIRGLAARSDLWGAWLTFHVWATIILSGAIFVIWPTALTLILAFLLIGSRQHGMAILMHDAAHGALFKTKALNEFVGHYLLALPFGGHLLQYRRYHLQHHKHAQRPEDPDLPLSAKFPVSKASLRRKLLRDITGWTAIRLRIGTLMMMRRQSAENVTEEEGSIEAKSDVLAPASIWPTVIANGVIFAILAALGLWWAYIALWLLPLLTWFQLVLRIRNISEHAMTSRDDNPLTHARTTQTNFLSRIFLAPYWVNYHVEHHAYMYVPCYRLPAIHREFVVRGHDTRMELKPSYRSVLQLATTAQV